MKITSDKIFTGGGGEAQEGEGLAVEAFPILGQSAAAAKPGEGAFDDPALRQDDEAWGVTQSLDDLEDDARENAFQRALDTGLGSLVG